jgi:hypothetical protein
VNLRPVAPLRVSGAALLPVRMDGADARERRTHTRLAQLSWAFSFRRVSGSSVVGRTSRSPRSAASFSIRVGPYVFGQTGRVWVRGVLNPVAAHADGQVGMGAAELAAFVRGAVDGRPSGPSLTAARRPSS